MILLSLLFFGYIVIVFAFCLLWQLHSVNNIDPLEVKSVSVVIPFRNEKNTLKPLLSSLEALNAASVNEFELEFIFINDHSDDGGDQFLLEHSFFRQANAKLLSLQSESGKKAALNLGIDEAEGEWIWQIDADVVFGDHTLIILTKLISPEVKMILGPVDLLNQKEKNTWLQNFQQIENVLLQWITGITSMVNKPVLANGANILYQKAIFKSYQETKIGQEYSSGDDLFLMNYVKTSYGGKAIRYCRHHFAVVTTYLKEDWSTLYNQKARWVGKMKSDYLKVSPVLKIMFFIVFLINYLLILSYLIDFISFKGLIGLMLFKLTFELFCFSIIQSFFKKGMISLLFPFFLLVYPFHLFKILKYAKINKINWKGRALK